MVPPGANRRHDGYMCHDPIIASEDVGARPLPALARLPVLPVQEPMFEHGMPGSEAMCFLQKRSDGRLIRDGCGAETYARHSTGSSSTFCALGYVHRQRNT